MKETNITGRLAGGNSRRAPMPYGWLRDIPIAMTGTFILKAIGGKASLCAPTVI
jgi:hypothetical protein